MSTNNIKRYTVKDFWDIYEVTLEVDLDVLTEAKATEINAFWTGAHDRLADSGDNVQHVVIQLFGEFLIGVLLEEGSVHFGPCSESTGLYWSKEVWGAEGWGGLGPKGEENELYGWCGIRCIGADVSVPTFESLELKEVLA
ncbi:DUF2528 family protein [Pseudomonas aeruginosa]